MSRQIYKDCTLCPRDCHADRLGGRMGYCGAGDQPVVARAALHYWEEPCISGNKGSGTVFFTGCSLGCVYCQNADISRGQAGLMITVERLSEIFMELGEKSAHNINLVTPTHYVPQIIEAVHMARDKGMNLPIVYNSSGYEKVETLKMLEGIVDIYLPDLKYMDQEPAERYSNCPDYFMHASKALQEMIRQTGPAVFDSDNIMKKGVIVRHLMLPGYGRDSRNIIRYLYDTYGDSIYISIMNQYTPMQAVKKYPEINRKLTDEEYDRLVEYAVDLGLMNGFIQEGGTASESFIPQFDNEGV